MRGENALVGIALAVLVLFMVDPTESLASSGKGIVHICPFLKPTIEENKLADASGRNRPVLGYSIQINDGEIYDVSHEESFEVPGLDVESKHLVKIFHSGKRVESFWFRFTNFDSEKVCLGIKLSYHTWQLHSAMGDDAECDCRRW